MCTDEEKETDFTYFQFLDMELGMENLLLRKQYCNRY